MSSPVVTFNGIERVETIINVLNNISHNAFPLLHENSSAETAFFHGLIMRSQLIWLLKGKRFLFVGNSLEESFQFIECGKPEKGASAMIADVKITAKEQQMFVDLHPYANTSPYTIVDSTSLSKAYSLFRRLGLRHLCVVPKVPNGFPIVGILTRHDFMPDHTFSLFPHLRRREWKKMQIQRFFTRSIRTCRKLWRTSLY
ncbi:hypothetical protein GOP47_0017955 [Adiantum capillus-veneris]|uniref:CBS domain-containing protein n=1 Tax=Adiantum capillus-veneris TaxID=13818 RepID=A0A9D4UGU5_ADICA|nr:hypothetical protein GOP47_0017955 [Adiantum capillus-veneris]